MKILFTITPAFNPNNGGVQRTTYKLGKYFTEKGLSVAYFSLSHSGHVPVEFGDFYSAKEPNREKSQENIMRLESVIDEFNPDFVINQMPYIKELRELLFSKKEKSNYILLGCLRNSLFNFTSNVRDRMQQTLPNILFNVLDNSIGINTIKLLHKLKHRRDLKAIIDHHDKFILLAPPNQDELFYFVGNYKKEKVLAISNSIPEITHSSQPKEKVILHVGRLDVPQKRSDLLASFWEKIYEQLPDWKFVIVGDGPYRVSLEKEIKLKKLPRIQMEGFQKPETYYEKATFFMMPSAYEGFPNTLLEAQSYGCIPFAFDSYAALSWIVTNETNAFLSPSFDINHMAANLIKLANNESKLELRKADAYTNASRFTIDIVGQTWIELFNTSKVDDIYN